jgi:hypothetical protein
MIFDSASLVRWIEGPLENAISTLDAVGLLLRPLFICRVRSGNDSRSTFDRYDERLTGCDNWLLIGPYISVYSSYGLLQPNLIFRGSAHSACICLTSFIVRGIRDTADQNGEGQDVLEDRACTICSCLSRTLETLSQVLRVFEP